MEVVTDTFRISQRYNLCDIPLRFPWSYPVKVEQFENVKYCAIKILLVALHWWISRIFWNSKVGSSLPWAEWTYAIPCSAHCLLGSFLGLQEPLVLPPVDPWTRKKNLDHMYAGIYALWIIRRRIKLIGRPHGIPQTSLLTLKDAQGPLWTPKHLPWPHWTND